MNGFAALIFALVAVSLVTGNPVKKCEKHGELMADDTDCSCFWECSFGVPIRLYCQEGLEYNPEKEYCDYPQAGGCHAEGGAPGVPDGSSNSNSRQKPTCPSDSATHLHQYPNPEDCHSFYKCSDKGVPVLIQCPAGLEYDAFAQVCDYPEQAQCVVQK
ncbi:peritrophin-1 [Anabrus simplex]|uniref:peritrophin-1 n=1 Tax=Anabrus simplex TaxID=316456 RepID=UPI0034DD2498